MFSGHSFSLLASACSRKTATMTPVVGNGAAAATRRYMNTTGRSRARVLLVGSGRMGHIRASLLYANPRFELCGVVDPHFQGANILAEKYNTTPYESLVDAMEDWGHNVEGNAAAQEQPALDGIILSTPTFTHESVIHQAAAAKLSVFTEKPVDETADQISALFDTAARHNIQLCCGFQRRFDESYVAVAKSLQQGKIGRPVSANIFFGDHPRPNMEFLLKGGNIFMDLSAHDVDFIKWALQDEVESVYATGTSSVADLQMAGVHDNATMVMKFSKGTVVTLTMSRSTAYGYDQRVEIFGSDGLVSVGNEHANMGVLANQHGFHGAKLKTSFPQRFHAAFGAELDAYANTLLKGTPWPVTRHDCVEVQRVADAARLSCDQGQVVHLEPSNTFWGKDEDDDVDEPEAVAMAAGAAAVPAYA